MSATSLGNPQSMNMYAYVQNNPVDYTDPSGLFKYKEPERPSEPDYSALLSLILGGRERTLEQPEDSGVIDGGGGGGGEPLTPPAEKPKKTQTDPCAGNKGQLDFSDKFNKGWGMDNHIFPRHIDRTQYAIDLNKSQYTFLPWQWDEQGYKDRVISIDQMTFMLGTPFESKNAVAYVYAFPTTDLGSPLGKIGMEVGKDNTTNNPFGQRGARTTVNTLVVSLKAGRCRSVITSHPGLPSNVSPSDISNLDPLWVIPFLGGWTTNHTVGN